MADRRGPSRRKDSKQMWEESERPRGPRDSRDTRESRPRDTRDDRDERDERRRSYRSRSRERERDRGGRRNGPRGEGRDRERERASGNNQGAVQRDAERSSTSNGKSNEKQRDDGRVRERRRSRSRGPRRSRSPRATREPNGRGGRDRPAREPVNSTTENTVLKSTEVHDANKMEIDVTVPSRSTHSSRHGSLAAHDGTPLPEILKTTNTVENNYDEDIEVEDDLDVSAMMGFGGFGSTQNKKVAGNNVSAVRKEKKTEYRQYMNRVGGFNRPLSPTRE